MCEGISQMMSMLGIKWPSCSELSYLVFNSTPTGWDLAG